MKVKLSVLAAVVAAVAAIVAFPAHGATVVSCPPGTTNPAYCQTTEAPTASVATDTAVEVLTQHGLPKIDTGTHVSCLPNLPLNCGGSTIITGDVGNAARVVTLARQGFAVRSGAKRLIVSPLNTRIAKRLYKQLRGRKITLRIKITTHGTNGRRQVTRRTAKVTLR